MEITKDWLHLLAGISALAFGLYCIVIGIWVVMFELVAFSVLLLILCFIFGGIYIIYGITALMTKKGQMSTFMAVGFFFGTYWWSSGLDWYMWPMIIMPIVILVLTILILLREYNRKISRDW